MTTCPRCGQPLQTPVPACPRCGQRFAPPPQQYQANNGYDEAPPAWGHQAPPQQQQQQSWQQPPAQGAGMYGQPAARPGFSVNELVSEEALPDWLRQASAESAQPTQRQPVPGSPGSPTATYAPQQGYPPAYPAGYPPANQPPAPGYGGYSANGGYAGNGNGNGGYGGYPPAPASAEEPPVQRPDASAFPSIESAGSYQAPLAGGGGMPASSLLDPNALPTWLGGQQGQAVPDGMRGGEGMRAQSLVDEAALPGWMRNEPASPAQAPVAAPPPTAPGWGGYPAPAAPAGAAIPPAGYGGMPNPMPMQPQMPMQPPAAPIQMNGQLNGQPGFSANQLIDPGALPEWMQNQGQPGIPQPGGMPQSAAAAPAPAQPGWSASDLIDPSMLPGFVRGNEAPAPTSDNNLARERTSRVPAPPVANPAAERDFGASRAGTAHRGTASRKHQAARPLGENEKPGWLREESQGGYGQDDYAAYPSGRQGRSDNGRNGYNGQDGYGDQDGYGGYDGYNDPNGYEDYSGYGAQNGQNGRNGQRGYPGQRGRMPEGQTGRGRAARDPRDGYETARRVRQQPTRQQAAEAPKKRKGGFFGFLRRG